MSDSYTGVLSLKSRRKQWQWQWLDSLSTSLLYSARLWRTHFTKTPTHALLSIMWSLTCRIMVFKKASHSRADSWEHQIHLNRTDRSTRQKNYFTVADHSSTVTGIRNIVWAIFVCQECWNLESASPWSSVSCCEWN